MKTKRISCGVHVLGASALLLSSACVPSMAQPVSGIPAGQSAPGIQPRADANSYLEHSEQVDFSVGAFLIPPEQVKKMFKPDLNHAGYVVIEVGVFPAPGKDIELNPTDFTLSVGEKSPALRPVSPDIIAEHVVGRPEPPRANGPYDVNTSTGIYVGHGSYPDPATGRRTNRTITGTEVGIGVGGPAPRSCRGYECDPPTPLPPLPQPSAGQTANAVSQGLWEKSLPDGRTVHPVAGYLYFPKPAQKAKNGAWELLYEDAHGKTRLPLSK